MITSVPDAARAVAGRAARTTRCRRRHASPRGSPSSARRSCRPSHRRPCTPDSHLCVRRRAPGTTRRRRPRRPARPVASSTTVDRDPDVDDLDLARVRPARLEHEAGLAGGERDRAGRPDSRPLGRAGETVDARRDVDRDHHRRRAGQPSATHAASPSSAPRKPVPNIASTTTVGTREHARETVTVEAVGELEDRRADAPAPRAPAPRPGRRRRCCPCRRPRTTRGRRCARARGAPSTRPRARRAPSAPRPACPRDRPLVGRCHLRGRDDRFHDRLSRARARRPSPWCRCASATAARRARPRRASVAAGTAEREGRLPPSPARTTSTSRNPNSPSPTPSAFITASLAPKRAARLGTGSC